jgi:hypothetical protein
VGKRTGSWIDLPQVDVLAGSAPALHQHEFNAALTPEFGRSLRIN